MMKLLEIIKIPDKDEGRHMLKEYQDSIETALSEDHNQGLA